MEKTIKTLAFIFLILFSKNALSQVQIPSRILNKIENLNNRQEIIDVFDFYCKPEDSLKVKAICFLLDNMHIHKTESYNIKSPEGEWIDFDELEFDNYRTSLRALKNLKKQHGSLKISPITTNDIESLDAQYLITNLEESFNVWSKSLYDFEHFCEYILPYRINVEPLYTWRKTYLDRFSKIIDKDDPIMPLKEKIKYLTDNINLWFVCTYGIEKREPHLPRLGSLQLLHRKKGTCEDVAALSVFALRGMGVASTVDVVPYWATSTGGHTLNCAFDCNRNPIHFDVLLQSDSLNEFIREPAKVFRTTYSVQKGSLSLQLEKKDIPPTGLLRYSNYIDVTHEYWKTRDIDYDLIEKSNENEVVYICTFNGMKWLPVWWGRSNKNKVTFTNMCQGAVFIPKYYRDGKLITAGYPVASGYEKVVELKPSEETHVIRVKEVPGHFKFKPGQKYSLAYYDFGWKPIATRVARKDTKELIIQNVPKNALLLLVSYDKKEIKTRPFTISESGERFWW